MRRWYLSKIEQVEEGPLTFYRHRLQDSDAYPGLDFQPQNFEVDPTTGEPLHPAVLCMVSGIDHTGLSADPKLIPMPDWSLDGKVAGISAARKVLAKNRIANELGYTSDQVNSVWDNADAYREVLNHYGQLNDASFDANNFDLTDL